MAAYFERRRVASVTTRRDDITWVQLDDGSTAYALTDVVGVVAPGDQVLVNTTAVELGLGTGGAHVVHANLTRVATSGSGSAERDALSGSAGAGGLLGGVDRSEVVVKARYLSEQSALVAPGRGTGDLPLLGARVLLCVLHSHAMAAAAACHDLGSGWSYLPRADVSPFEMAEFGGAGRNVAYVMSDGGALPYALSDLANELTERGLLSVTVTAGQSFGAEVEAVSVVDAVLVALERGCRRVVVGPGPGHVGTGTQYGFSGIELAGTAALLGTLGAEVGFCVRASSTDDRLRHRGVSHHSLTLARLATGHAVQPVPAEVPEVGWQLSGAAPGAQLRSVRSVSVPAVLRRHQLQVDSMGGDLAEDDWAWRCIGAASRWLAHGDAAAASRWLAHGDAAAASQASVPSGSDAVEVGYEHPLDDESATDAPTDGTQLNGAVPIADAPALASAVAADTTGRPAAPTGVLARATRGQSNRSRSAVEWGVLIVASVALALLIRVFVLGAFYIPSTSMAPALDEGDRVLVNKLAYLTVDPALGDVVVIAAPESQQPFGPAELIKRVVAVGGDEVQGVDGHVRVNGMRVNEPYLTEQGSTSNFGPITVDEGHIFVLGDHRVNSQDSRTFGQVPFDEVVGRAFAKYWPPSSLGGL